MYSVEVVKEVDCSYRRVSEKVTPENIVEYADIYEIQSQNRTDHGELIVIKFNDRELELEFTELEDGYEYEFGSDKGLFEYRYSKITLHNDNPTRIVAESRYTFGSIWSVFINRLASGSVKMEFETIIENLIDDLASESNGPAEFESREQ